MPEFLNYVRANPGKVNYATGNGTSILTTAQLALAEKLDMQHIPYKGDAPATADLIAGRVQVMIGTPGSAMPQVQEGRLRVLATLLSRRSPLAPDAPTSALTIKVSDTYIASISPRLTARVASALPLYPSTTWQSSLSVAHANAAPSDSPSVGPPAAHRHFIFALRGLLDRFCW